MAKTSNSNQDRVELFLRAFAKEHPDIRAQLAAELPTYNELLDLHALSFEEFALLSVAKAQGCNIAEPFFSCEGIVPPCPKCKNKSSAKRVADNAYVCASCGNRFAANWKSLSSGTKCSSLTWLKVLHCMLDFYTVARTCDVCGISKNTYYKIRNKLFYAMMLLLDDVKLYGNVQVDHTFISVSYKGQTLDDKEYPEDSVFFNTKFLPRQARQRGGAYSMSERTVNTICILTAADDFGHVVTRFVGIGATNTNLISQTFGNDRLLLTVPEKDPFAALNRRKKRATALQPGEPSLLISDGEIAIERFAKIYGIQHEWHVFRSDGVQRKLPEGYHDIQVVNNLHSRLKTFLKQTNHASSRYLPGFLILFDFIINTGATKEAIRELFCILAKQNGAKNDQFFEDLFSVPNYLLQWAKEDNPLSHLKFNEILGYFLYDQRFKGSTAPFRFGSMDDVAERCGLTREQLRINYKNFKATPIGDAILNYFATVAATGSPPGKRSGLKKEITAVDLAVYDELYKWRIENPYSTLHFDLVLPDLNKRYNAKYTQGSLQRIMAVIPEEGRREPIPKKIKYNDAKVFKPGQWKEIQMYEEYWALKAEYRRKGLKPPKRDDLCAELAAKHGLTKNRVISLITHIPAGYSKGKCNYAAPPQNTSA